MLSFTANQIKAEEKASDTIKAATQEVVANVDGVSKDLVYITEKLGTALNTIGSKLGVATDHVWTILVKQAVVNAWLYTGMLLLSILLLSVVGVLHFRFMKDDGNRESAYYKYEEGLGIPMVIAALISFAFFIFMLTSLPDIFTGFNNPEYIALKEILKAL
jgi:hypothetical protein